MSGRSPRREPPSSEGGSQGWPVRDAVRRPGTLAAASSTGLVTLVVAITTDASTGRGVSVVGGVTLALAAAVLGGLWVDLPREQCTERRRAIRRLLAVSTVSLLVFIGVYLLAQRSTFGQRFERDVLLGRSVGIGRLQGGSTRILDQVTAGSAALVAAAACCVAVLRGRLRLALATGIAAILTLGSAALLKALLLPRPVLLGGGAIATATSYPSGHVAAGAAMGAALLIAVPSGWRVRAALAAMTLTGAIGVAVLLAGWHRPSDTIGGVVLATGWFGAAAAVLVRKQRPSPRGSPAPRLRIPTRVWLAGAYLLAGGALVFSLVELVRLRAQLDAPRHLAAFLAGTLVFLAVDVFAFAALTASLPSDADAR
jgi:hypothetical protein